MSINLTVPTSTENPELKPRITVVGVGGAGGNAVNNMIRRELEGVDFVVANTDAQSLSKSLAERRIQLGTNLTQGLGAGSKPEIGQGAAEEAIDDVLSELKGVHMAFIAAGMGGGTGTGAAPVIAKAAREAGILTVGVVTKPFQFEGSHRMKMAEQGIADLEQHVDTLIIIPNQNLFRIANENTTFADAFNMADEVLYSGVRGVTDLIVMPGLINLDFADIRSVMEEMGKAMMGTGEASGDRRALDAAEAAIANPLLEDMSMKGAKGVLINITGGQDVTLFEVDEAATRIRAEVDADAHIIVGSAFDPDLNGTMRVSVVATGIDANAAHMPVPTMLNMADQGRKPVVSEMTVLELPEEPAEAVAEAATAKAVDEPAEPVGESENEHEVVAESPNSLERLIEEIDANAQALEKSDTAESADAKTENNAEAEAKMEPEAAPEMTEAEPEAPVTEAEPEKTEAQKAPAPSVAAMPTLGATDAFIPPKPVSNTPKTEAPEADPFRAADMTNGARKDVAESTPAAASKPKPSLFERVTRTGRAAAAPAGEPQKALVAEESPTDTTVSQMTPPRSSVMPFNSAPSMASGGGQNAALAQDEIAGLEVQSEPVRQESEDEDDMLDIPAFLRRQAN